MPVRAWVEGVLVRGHGIASGQALDSPYPAGSIALQAPCFRRLGLDLSPYVAATLNLSVAPQRFVPIDMEYHFPGLAWTTGLVEDFSLSACEVRFAGRRVDGLIYYPHPDTKPDHFQAATTVEVIARRIHGLALGDRLGLGYDPRRVGFS